jgi:NitT/TauT family transport system substrate-binding protein
MIEKRAPFHVARFCALVVSALVLIACGDGDGGSIETTAPTEPESVTFALSFLPTVDTAGWYTALDEGLFEAENLEVEIVRGFGSGDTVKRVATGEVDFGVADFSALVPLRINEDIPVVAIASFFAESPNGVIFPAGQGISEPKDLEGRSIACSANNANMLLFPAFAEATGIDPDAIEWKLSDPGAHTAAFASGLTDASCDFFYTLPLAESMAGEELEVFSYADHGVAAYGLMLVASQSTVDDRPDLVERFLRAALAGVQSAIENPEEGLATFLSHAPEDDPDISRAAWEMIIERGLLTSEDTDTHGLGYISPERIATNFDILVAASGLDVGDYTVEDMYRDDFLP